jgi:hypothetical protein
MWMIKSPNRCHLVTGMISAVILDELDYFHATFSYIHPSSNAITEFLLSCRLQASRLRKKSV